MSCVSEQYGSRKGRDGLQTLTLGANNYTRRVPHRVITAVTKATFKYLGTKSSWTSSHRHNVHRDTRPPDKRQYSPRAQTRERFKGLVSMLTPFIVPNSYVSLVDTSPKAHSSRHPPPDPRRPWRA